jgi:hypothetical protein
LAHEHRRGEYPPAELSAAVLGCLAAPIVAAAVGPRCALPGARGRSLGGGGRGHLSRQVVEVEKLLLPGVDIVIIGRLKGILQLLPGLLNSGRLLGSDSAAGVELEAGNDGGQNGEDDNKGRLHVAAAELVLSVCGFDTLYIYSYSCVGGEGEVGRGTSCECDDLGRVNRVDDRRQVTTVCVYERCVGHDLEIERAQSRMVRG